MSANLLSSILDSMTNRITSSEHDVSKTTVAGMTGTRQEQIDRLKSGAGGWDEAEYGISRAAQIAKLEAANTPEAQEQERKEMVSRAIARHQLDTSTGRVAALFAKKPGWHSLGTVFEKELTTLNLKDRPEVNFRLSKKPMYVWTPTGPVEDEDAFSIHRDDTGAKLTTQPVGSRYQVIQQEQAWDFLDGVVGEYGARYESVGSIYGGRQVWCQIHFPKHDFSIPGTTEYPFITLLKRNDGSGKDWIYPTMIRAECANTTTLSFKSRGADAKGLGIRHTGDIKAKIADARKALNISIKGFTQHKEEVVTLAAHDMNPTEFSGLCSDVLDAATEITAAQIKLGADVFAQAIANTVAEQELAKKTFARREKARSVMLDDILNRYESKTNAGHRGKLWGGYNAVSESADHGKLGGRYQGDDHTRASRRFESVLGGNAADLKELAYEQVLTMAR